MRWDLNMGLYAWIAIGFAVALVARVIGTKRVNSGWLEPVLMGIAGAVVGGWIGGRITGTDTIDNLGVLAMIVAAIGAAVLVGIYLVTRRRTAPAATKMTDLQRNLPRPNTGERAA